MKQRAFTLIELLVVIAIIGLLTTLVLVNTSSTRGKARVAKGLEFSSSVYNALGSEVVGIWNFDNGTGTIAYDNSGYGNNGTLTNGPLFATDTPYYVVGSGTGKYSMHFDGADDYVDLNNSTYFKMSGSRTLEAWFKTSASGVYQSIIAKGFYEVGSYEIIQINTDYLRFEVFGLTPPTIDSSNKYNDGYWHNVVGVYDSLANKIFIYLDGKLENSRDVTGSSGISEQNVNIGRRPATSYFNGFIDDVRIYNVALTALQIQQQYAKELGRHQDLATITE